MWSPPAPSTPPSGWGCRSSVVTCSSTASPSGAPATWTTSLKPASTSPPTRPVTSPAPSFPSTAGGRPRSRLVADLVHVVAAVIQRESRYLITRRSEGTHLAGLWEFPGGKVGTAESPEAALRRELREELGVDALVGDLMETVTWSYPEKTVRILFFRCAFPDADRQLVERLSHA